MRSPAEDPVLGRLVVRRELGQGHFPRESGLQGRDQCALSRLSQATLQKQKGLCPLGPRGRQGWTHPRPSVFKSPPPVRAAHDGMVLTAVNPFRSTRGRDAHAGPGENNARLLPSSPRPTARTEGGQKGPVGRTLSTPRSSPAALGQWLHLPVVTLTRVPSEPSRHASKLMPELAASSPACVSPKPISAARPTPPLLFSCFWLCLPKRTGHFCFCH